MSSFTCLHCGAIVGELRKHYEWHDRLLVKPEADFVEVPWPRFRLECPAGHSTDKHRFYEVKK